MEEYWGRRGGGDEIIGGGSFNEKNQWGGHEEFNFKPFRGNCYGYAPVEPNLARNFSNSEAGAVDSLLVVWFALHPEGGQVIVGWYKNATLFGKTQEYGRSGEDGDNCWYIARAAQNNCYMVPARERNFPVPLSRQAGRGFTGSNALWYCDPTKNKKVAAYARAIFDYVDSNGNPTIGGKRTRTVDAKRNRQVEMAAIKCVTDFYVARKYDIVSVESLCVGWDLEATSGKETLRIEVKGRSGPDPVAELSPNEYRYFSKFRPGYRLCIVTNARGKKPVLYKIAPKGKEMRVEVYRKKGTTRQKWSKTKNRMRQARVVERTGATISTERFCEL